MTKKLTINFISSDMERCYICDSYYTSTHLPMIRIVTNKDEQLELCVYKFNVEIKITRVKHLKAFSKPIKKLVLISV